MSAFAGGTGYETENCTPKACRCQKNFREAPAFVGADQAPLPVLPSIGEEALGQLGRGGLEDTDVVIGAVGARAAAPQHAGEDFPGAVARAVIDTSDERGETVPALERPAASSLSPCEATNVASKSTISGGRRVPGPGSVLQTCH
nr:hypothetical protein [Arthrobacter sp. MA-N2]